MKLIIEELELDEVPKLDANSLNHNLFGPIRDAVCEVYMMLDRRHVLFGTGFGMDQDGGEHEMEFEVVISNNEFEALMRELKA